MKALTVKQPWAYLICAGIKDIENRTWKTNFRGRVLIHAGADRRLNSSVLTEPQYNCLRKLIDKWHYENSISEWERLSIIGSVEIVDCVQNHPSMWADKGVWNWVLAKPVLFAKPIENVKGKLSFWESGYDVCHICREPTQAEFICKYCDEHYCSECSTQYNQFTQIDYNCCKCCADVMYDL